MGNWSRRIESDEAMINGISEMRVFIEIHVVAVFLQQQQQQPHGMAI